MIAGEENAQPSPCLWRWQGCRAYTDTSALTEPSMGPKLLPGHNTNPGSAPVPSLSRAEGSERTRPLGRTGTGRARALQAASRQPGSARPRHSKKGGQYSDHGPPGHLSLLLTAPCRLHHPALHQGAPQALSAGSAGTSSAKAATLDPSQPRLPILCSKHTGVDSGSTPLPAADSAGPNPQFPLGGGGRGAGKPPNFSGEAD